MVEVYVNASLKEAKRRDPKGLYRDHQSGKFQGLIGVSNGVPYETPENPDVKLDSEDFGADECASKLVNYLLGRK